MYPSITINKINFHIDVEAKTHSIKLVIIKTQTIVFSLIFLNFSSIMYLSNEKSTELKIFTFTYFFKKRIN